MHIFSILKYDKSAQQGQVLVTVEAVDTVIYCNMAKLLIFNENVPFFHACDSMVQW